jgi:outer membrane protein
LALGVSGAPLARGQEAAGLGRLFFVAGVCAVLLTYPKSAWAQAAEDGQANGAKSGTLEQALIAAYANNPALKADQAGVRATDELVPQALSGWRPTLEAEGSAASKAIYNNTRTAPADRQHIDPRSLSLTLSQPLFTGGQTVAATGEAKNTVLAERARLITSEQDILLAAVEAHMGAFRDQAVLDLKVNNEQVLKRQLEATMDRFQVGETTRTDVHQAEARLARATADRIQAEGNLEASRASYRNVVGAVPGVLVAPKPVEGLPEGLEEAIKTAVVENPDVIAAEFDEKASRHNVNEQRGQLFPSLDLTGTASRSLDAASEGTRTDGFEAKLTLSVPFYQSGSVYSEIREAKQLAAEKRKEIEQIRRDSIEDATRAWESLQASRARIKSFKAEVKAASIALEGVEREEGVGLRTVLDILNAEQELLDAKVNLVGAERDESVAAHELLASMGHMTARKLGLQVDYYNPAAHYEEVEGKWFGASSNGEVE